MMRKTRVWLPILCSILAVSALAGAQTTRKPGLWETTTQMTWQQSPMPAGMTMPPGAHSPFGGGPITSQVCLTQEMIDKYGAPMPQSQRGDCQIVNVSIGLTGMTANLVCTGQVSGKGSVESNWTIPDHARGKVHFVGTMQMGGNSRPIEWTSESTSVFKGPDCGSVKPYPMPKGN
jgi:hypothetical protein